MYAVMALTTHFCRDWRLWIYGMLLYLSLAGCAAVSSHTQDQDRARNDLVSTALSMQGRPYRYGGNTPSGFDCSGLVYYSFQQVGMQVPRNSYKQYKASSPVYISRMQPGDLIFFRIDGIFVSHVGIYIGNDQFIHAAGKSKHVRIDNLKMKYWQKHLVGAGSFLN